MQKSKYKYFSLQITIWLLIFGIFLSTMGCENTTVKEIESLCPSFSLQWGLYNNGQIIQNKKGVRGIDINILKAWEITKGSPEVFVGVLDSGIDITNVELKHCIYKNEAEIFNNTDDDNNNYIDDVNGWNFYENNNIIYSSYLHDHHGTYISSIIAASHEAGEICGVAPNVQILPLKFIQSARGDMKDAVKAIEYAHNLGVRIINCSWDNTIYSEELQEIMRTYSDILFVCSAGKNKDDLSNTPVYPACFDLPNVISVAAIDNQGNLYEYSGYGKEADVAAPGVDIYAAMPEGDYTYSSGTSPATAFVTGIAALIKSYNAQLTSVEIADILKTGVREIPNLNGKVMSGGIVDAYLCLQNSES